MQKQSTKTIARDPAKAIRVKRTSELTGVSTGQIYKVIRGDHVNEEVMSIYMFLSEGEENLLLQAVKKAVPFN